jgi:hypothetical protein
MVMRTQETRKIELHLKRNNYQKVYVIKENKETISFIYFNWKTNVKDFKRNIQVIINLNYI